MHPQLSGWNPTAQVLQPEPRFLYPSHPHMACGSSFPGPLESDHFASPAGPSTIVSHLIVAVASARVSRFLPLSTRWPEGPVITCGYVVSVQNPPLIPTSLGVRTYVLTMAYKALCNMTPIIPPTSSDIFPLGLSTPATMASLLILKCARHTPASGPLHRLLLLPRAFFPQIVEWFILPLLHHFLLMLPSREAFPNLFNVPISRHSPSLPTGPLSPQVVPAT